jgi:hypothetical protein
MLRKLMPRSVYDVMAALACLGVLAGGTAYAANTVFSTDIVDGQVKSVDIGDGEVGSADVKDNSINTFDVHSFLGADVVDESLTTADIQNGSLTGFDINEGMLSTVPSALLGGYGRPGERQNGQTGPGSCNPQGSSFVNCDIGAHLSLPAPARVLVIGTVRAVIEQPGSGTAYVGSGACRLGTTSGVIAGTTNDIFLENGGNFPDEEHVTIAGLTGVFPSGQHAFGIDCNEIHNITYDHAQVTAVALSAG